jgi:hypothetical protein
VPEGQPPAREGLPPTLEERLPAPEEQPPATDGPAQTVPEDALTSFIRDRLEFVPGAVSSWNDLKRAYQQYAEEKRGQEVSTRAFGSLDRQLRRHGGRKTGAGAERVWEGVRLR